MSKWPMRGHFRYLSFKIFPMTLRTPQCEVFCPLLSSSEHSGVPEDSNSQLFQVLGFTPTLGQSGVATPKIPKTLSAQGLVKGFLRFPYFTIPFSCPWNHNLGKDKFMEICKRKQLVSSHAYSQIWLQLSKFKRRKNPLKLVLASFVGRKGHGWGIDAC
jgi:hypothetical protein